MSRHTSESGTKRLHVGVTGHRPGRMPHRHWQRIGKDITKVMASLEKGIVGRRPVLLSGLAEGADRLAAFVALGRGWSLHAILAFDRARFERDFPEAVARGEFRALLSASDTVEEPRVRQGRPPEEYYEAVGQRLLAASDVLIAVWDGQGSRGKGGTIEVIEQAKALGTRVVWVHAKGGRPPQYLNPN